MSRLRRALLVLLLVLIASPVLLWFGANAFLNVGLEPILNEKPDKLRIRWTLAWMWMPGDVSVWGLEIRGQGKNDQFLITNDHATATVDVRALTERTFRASNVKGSGASFRYRFRAPAPVDPATDDTPPIVGLTNPPDPIPPPGKSKKGPWTIDLQGMDVDDVREVWVEGIRYVGSAHVVGDLRLGGEISVAAKLTMPTGQLLRGDDLMVQSLTGEAGGSLSGIIRGQPITPEVLASMAATAHVKAQTDDLSFVNYYLQAAPWLKLDGRAELAVDVDVKDGAYVLGSVVTAHTTDLAVDLFAYQIRGDGTARLEVVSGKEGPETHMGVNYGQFTIKESGAEDAGVDPLVAGSGFELTAVSPETDIGKPRTNMNVLVKIPESTIPNVRRFDRFLPTGAGLSIVGGSGKLAAYLEVSTSTGRLAGAVDLTGNDVAVNFDGLRITFDPGLHAKLVGGDPASGVYDFSGTAVSIDQLGMRDLSRDDEKVTRDWWARITATDGKVNVGAPTFLDGRIAMQCANSEPIVTVLLQKKNLPRWVQDAMYVPNVKGTANVQMGDDTIVVNPLDVSGGTELNVKMRFYRKGTSSTGAMYARFNKFSVAVDMDPGDTDIHMFDAKDWYEGKNADKEAAKDAKQEKKEAKKEERAKKKADKKSSG